MGDTAAQIRNRYRLTVGLCAIPWAACAVLAASFAMDAPYWDEWDRFLPVIAKSYAGTLQPSDLWVRVNEHLFVVPALIVVPLARLTHWNMPLVCGLTLVAYTFAFVQLVELAQRSRTPFHRREGPWVLFIVALLFFSCAQHAIFVWSLHVAVAIAVVFLLATIRVLSGSRLSMRSVALAIVLAGGASLSFGAGVSVWPAGLLAVGLRRDVDPRRRIGVGISWIAAAGFFGFVYLSAREARPDLPAMVDLAAYVVAFLGAPIALTNGFVAFAFGIVFLAIVGVLIVRNGFVGEGGSALAGLATIGLVVAVLSGLKHSHEGVHQAVSSRLLPWPTLSWCAVVLALGRESAVRTIPRNLRVAALVFIAVLAAGTSAAGAYRAEIRHDAFLLGRDALLHHPDDPALGFLHPDPDRIRSKYRPLLIEHELACFRRSADDV